MGGKSDAPKVDPRIGEAALQNAALGREWLSFSRDQFASAQKRQGKMDSLTQSVIGQQLQAGREHFEAQREARDWARKDRKRYEEVALPMRDQIMSEAKSFGSKGHQEQAAAEAGADVASAAAGQREQTQRRMASMGVSPLSGRFAGIDSANDTAAALAMAGAKNQARRQVRDQGRALRVNATNMESGLPGQAMAASGLGINAGNAGVGAGGAALSGAHQNMNSFRANSAIMGQGFQGAMSGNSSMASILGAQFDRKMQGYQLNQQNDAAKWQAAGTVAGAALMFSSKEAKTDKKPVKGALEAVKRLPVESWQYKKEAQGKAPAGVIPPDGERHIGTYAEDFAKQTGQGDGKTIPVQDAIGVTMKAVQELDQKVDKLAGRRLPARKKRA